MPSSRDQNAPGPCPDRIRALLVGGGGREHALAWRLSQSPRIEKIWLTNPENPGLAALGEPCPVALEYRELWRLTKWLDQAKINLVVIGPDAHIAAGLADEVRAPGRAVFGVGKDAARLEADKAWAKALMRSAAIPTAEGRSFSTYDQAIQYLESRDEVPVIKASGLAAGKGAYVPATMDDARTALKEIMKDRIFGDAGNTVVIEEKLSGPELSITALVDGKNIYVLETAQDHKRAFEADKGPNTGGMGTYSPVPFIDDKMMARIEHEILVPTLDALRREEIDYRGVLYAGLMLTPGGPKVLEFNARFGDPETQSLMLRFRGDLAQVMWATAAGKLDEVQIDWDPRAACCIIMAAEGYPGKSPAGKPITGLDALDLGETLQVFMAGVRRDEKGSLVTAGGRVLGVTALGENILRAREHALQACRLIRFEGAFWRRDIGHQAIPKP